MSSLPKAPTALGCPAPAWHPFPQISPRASPTSWSPLKLTQKAGLMHHTKTVLQRGKVSPSPMAGCSPAAPIWGFSLQPQVSRSTSSTPGHPWADKTFGAQRHPSLLLPVRPWGAGHDVGSVIPTHSVLPDPATAMSEETTTDPNLESLAEEPSQAPNPEPISE